MRIKPIIPYPVRINRYMALKNYCTRRKADEFIEAGRVKINGVKARLGDKVQRDDVVEVASKAFSKIRQSLKYFAYNKPVGVMVHKSEEGQKDIKSTVKLDEGVVPLGNLGKESSGLVVLTNDGRVTDRLLNPKYDHEREYTAKVNKAITQNFVTRMSKGVKIEGYITKPATLIANIGSKKFKMAIHEAKKHQVARMCTALGYEVVDLKRSRILNIRLSQLNQGEMRELKGKELKVFLKELGLLKR